MSTMSISTIAQLKIAIKLEIKKAFRTPSFSIPTVIMPVIFYALFGLMLPGSPNGPIYLMATYVVFAAMAPGLFGIGVNLAAERASGWTDLIAASPANPIVIFVSRIVMALLFALISASTIILLAIAFGGVTLSLGVGVSLIAICLFAAVPFASLGLLIGSKFAKGGASAMANLLFLPMAVLSGLWFPLQIMPEPLQMFANILPTYHIAQISLSTVLPMAPLSWTAHISAWVIWTTLPAIMLLKKSTSKKKTKKFPTANIENTGISDD